MWAWIILVIEEIFATPSQHTLPGHIAHLFTGRRDVKKGTLCGDSLHIS
jgi:hypothetical protein